MKRFLSIAALSVWMLAAGASPGWASWVSEHCYTDNHVIERAKRDGARAYAGVARDEGYEWGGGCWNDDNRDNSPLGVENSEGPDCSGLVFKSWRLRWTYGADGFRWYNKFENRHGPYSSTGFHAPQDGLPFFRLPNKERGTTMYMDSFAKEGHVALLWSDKYPSSHLDFFIEAYTDESGTRVSTRGYRFDGAFRAARRKNWTPDCYPRCDSPASSAVVIIP